MISKENLAFKIFNFLHYICLYLHECFKHGCQCHRSWERHGIYFPVWKILNFLSKLGSFILGLPVVSIRSVNTCNNCRYTMVTVLFFWSVKSRVIFVIFVGSNLVILVPRGRDPSGLRQESRPLAASNSGSPRFTVSLSNITNLIG